MWRNTDVVAFLQWLRAFNDAQAFDEAKVGFYGLDLYSMRASMDAVVDYLQRHEPDAAEDARERYACFDLFQGEGQHYGHAVTMNYAAPCEEEVVQQLLDLRERRQQLLSQDGWLAQDDYFFAEQNARLVLNAEHYYRQMYRGSVSSWNLRDSHMGQTLEELVRHLESRRSPAKVVVWAHNSHVGDARHTQMGAHGELNIGQLVREAAGDDCVNVGFTTHHGQVTAASEWGGPAERKRVRRSLPASYEEMFHELDGHGGRGVPRAHRRGGPAAQPARAGDRRDLPARHRAHEPLVPRRPGRPVRRGHPPRPHARAAPARAHAAVGHGRAAGDLPDRACSRPAAGTAAGRPRFGPVGRLEPLDSPRPTRGVA